MNERTSVHMVSNVACELCALYFCVSHGEKGTVWQQIVKTLLET